MIHGRTRYLLSHPESRATRWVILVIVTVVIVGGFPIMAWYRISENKAADETHERTDRIKEEILRHEEARRWILAESRRHQRAKTPDDCKACAGLGLVKASPPPEMGKAARGIVDCKKCGGTGVR